MNSRVVCIVAVIFVVHSFVYAISTDENDYDSEEDYSEFSNTNSTNSTLILTLGLKNITRSSGKTVKLICEVQNLDSNNTNSKVIFTWKKNEAPIEKDNRIKMRTDKGDDNKFKSTLRITKWEYFDSGFFECIASNGIDKVRSHAFITATPDNNRYGTADMSPLDFGTQNSDKFGEMTTFVPNSISKSESTNFLTTIAKAKKFSPVVEFDYTSTGRITEKMPVYSSNESFCQKYRGVKCRSYLQNMNVFVQPPFTQDEIEEKLDRAFVVISQSNDISTNCNKFAQPSLCFSAFPVCLDATRIQKYQEQFTNDMKYNSKFTKDKFKNIRNNLTKSLRRICKDECTLLENEYCSKEYSIAKTHSVIGQIMELEECEQLPLETHESTDNCLTLGVGDLNTIRDENCYWYNGKFYKGVQDTSKYGNRCMRWSHKFQMTTLYPELAGHNYCRNPDDSEEEPFCFVEQNRKEVCGISKCEYIFGGYAGITLFLTAVIMAIIFYYCYHCKRNKIARNLQNKDLPTVNKNIYGNPGPSSPIEMNTLLPPHLPAHRNHNSNKNSIQSVPQYTYKEVRLLEELGEGAFGKVYKGELKTKSGKIFVAVKSLKENASAKTQADFQREIELISELKHPNIICLLGVVMKQEPMCMLFEFMSEGDLHEFLIGNSPEEGKCLTHDQFLHIAIQIAQGMEYLSGNHYVHRDLAARNCLVSKDMVVKISDFGLSRDMYSCDYYRVQSKSLLPVRWMPPESILYGKFTTESDVWSYGVVLWEIYSYGLQPYYGYNNQEVISMIRSRKLLPCPDACPSYCYSLMVECWAEQAIRRPNFSEIAHRLKVWKQSGTSNGAYYKTSSAQPTPQKYGHCSKSSHTSDSQIGQNDNLSSTWERERQKPTTTSRHDSQSSLTSRTSSVGNNTQSTSVSNEGRRERRSRRNVDSLERLNPKNTVVSCSNGENFETKISQ